MNEKETPTSAMKYAGLGFQLVAVSLGLIFTGLKLDKLLNLTNVFLLVAVFIAVFAVIFILINRLK